MRTAIIGAGIGGLTAAMTLRRLGHEVEIYEQADALREVGAGIQISPNGTRLLHRLGLGPALDRVATRPIAMKMRRWEDGSVLSRKALAGNVETTFGAPYNLFYRPELLEVLASGVPSDIIHLGHRCTGVGSRADQVELAFENGRVETADLVVGADGIHSVVREQLFGPDAPRFSGHVAYRGLVPYERVADLDLEPTMTAWLGPHRHFVHYAIGQDSRFLNFAAAVPAEIGSKESWSATGRIEDALLEFAGWHPQIAQILRAADGTNRWGLFDRDPLEHWFAGRVVLLGDAAHAMLPYMAQGAVQSVEDAFVLARCLEGVDGSDGAGLHTALRRYQGLRQPRVYELQTRARQNGATFHLPDGPEQRARDARLAEAVDANPLLASAWLYGRDVEAEVGE